MHAQRKTLSGPSLIRKLLADSPFDYILTVTRISTIPRIPSWHYLVQLTPFPVLQSCPHYAFPTTTVFGQFR